MMKKIILLAFGLMFPMVYSQNFLSEFEKYHKENNLEKQEEILQKWEQNSPKDAELFTSFFNYYVSKARSEKVALSKEKIDSKDAVEIERKEDGEIAYLGTKIFFDEEILGKGIAKIDEGIKLFPNRLDMRFGKIYILGQNRNWKNFTNEIIKVVEQSAKNKNAWTWTNNQPLKNAKERMLSSIQDYQVQLYNTENDELLVNMWEIADAVLKYYPNDIRSYNNKAMSYIILGEYDKGLEILLKAEKIAPNDEIVLSNIARVYELKGEKQKEEIYRKKIKNIK